MVFMNESRKLQKHISPQQKATPV